MPIPAFGAAGTYYTPGGTGTSAAPAVPAGTAANDVVIVTLYLETTAAVTPASGFAEIPTAPAATGTQAHTFRQFWKRATGADSGSYTFSWTGAAYRDAVAVRYTDCVLNGTPYELVAVANRDTTTVGTTPAVSLTTTYSNRLVVWSGSNFTTGAWTPPTNFTERVDAVETISVATRAMPAPGANTSVTGTCAGNGASCAWILALRGEQRDGRGFIAGALTR